MDVIRRFPSDSYTKALESWRWMNQLASMTPALATPFGDVFMQDCDGSFCFLDTLNGKLVPTWPDAASLQAAINTREVQDEYLMLGLAHAASSVGLEPGPDQILSFKVPPVLGGELSVENLEVADFVVAVNVAGQIHGQVTSLPPGTPITNIRID